MNSIPPTVRKVSKHIPSNKPWIGCRPFRSFQSDCIRIGLTISDRIQRNVYFDPIGDCNPVGPKKWRWFPATGPLEKRETALDRSWRKLQVILRRGRLISNIFGAKAHANVLKGTFSTDYKSNCIRIGPRHTWMPPLQIRLVKRRLGISGVIKGTAWLVNTGSCQVFRPDR